MRIMMVTEAFGGGVFAYMSQLCNLLCNEIEIYWVHGWSKQTPEDYKKKIDKRIHLIPVAMSRDLLNIRNISKVIRELRKVSETINPDIIHLHSSIAGGFGRLAFNGKKIPVVYTPHGYSFILMGPGKKSNAYKLLEIVLGRRNCITLTCCKSEDDVAKTLCKRTEYIETGIDLSPLEKEICDIPKVKNKRFTVFTLGRICVQKRPDLFNQIALSVPEADFVWIGGGELVGELTASNIKVTGWLPREEALAMAMGADVFVLCSYGEAIAMSLLENMYMKKLCIVSNAMGNKSVIKDGINGFLCSTAEEYASRIRESMEKFPLQLPQKAFLDVLEKYSLNTMKTNFIDFYTRILVQCGP